MSSYSVYSHFSVRVVKYEKSDTSLMLDAYIGV